jgi:hypothetical protein
MDMVVSLPAGVKVDSIPVARQEKQSFADYSLTCALEDGPRLHIQRDLVIGKSLIPRDQYPVVKSFFAQVRAGDDEKIVLSVENK